MLSTSSISTSSQIHACTPELQISDYQCPNRIPTIECSQLTKPQQTLGQALIAAIAAAPAVPSAPAGATLPPAPPAPVLPPPAAPPANLPAPVAAAAAAALPTLPPRAPFPAAPLRPFDPFLNLNLNPSLHDLPNFSTPLPGPLFFMATLDAPFLAVLDPSLREDYEDDDDDE